MTTWQHDDPHGPQCASRFHTAAECTCGKADTLSRFEEEYGTEDECPRAPYPAPADRRHRPDWDNVSIENDGNGEVFVDVVCVNCGRSGCLARLLLNGTRIDW